MKELIKKIKKCKRVAIFAHTSPDPDCLSSMAALSCILKQFNKSTKFFVDCKKLEQDLNELYAFSDEINGEFKKDDFDTVFVVDVGKETLLGKYSEQVKNFPNTIVIDHHSSRSFEGTMTYVNNNRSSCCEIIFELAKCLKVNITPEIATHIYAGIIGDTSCFLNDNTTENSFYVARECLLCGANIKKVNFLLQKHQTTQQLKLKQIGYQNMVIKNKIAYMIFTKKMFNEAGVDDCPSFVNELLNIDNNIFAFVIKQKEKNVYTVSFRCKDGYDVTTIANIIGGGGHKQAAGGLFVGAPVKHAKLFYEECLKQIKER